MKMDEAQIFFNCFLKRSGKKYLFLGKPDGLAKTYLPVVYANGETTLGIGTYPSLVGDGGTFSAII